MRKSSNELGVIKGTIALSETDRHRLLSSQERRAVMDLLEERQLPMDLQEIATGIAGRQHGEAERRNTSVDRAKVRLHHNHLPKMDDFGVINYDLAAKRVERANISPEL